MRSYQCPCGALTKESNADWDVLSRTRRCPRCARPRDGFVLPADEDERSRDLANRRNLVLIAIIARLGFYALLLLAGALSGSVPEDIVYPLLAIYHIGTLIFALVVTARLCKAASLRQSYTVAVIFGLLGVVSMAIVYVKSGTALKQMGYVRRFA